MKNTALIAVFLLVQFGFTCAISLTRRGTVGNGITI